MADQAASRYRVYWSIEQRIVPGLRNSQYGYYETLKQFTRPDADWLDLGCGHHVFGWWMEKEQQEVIRACRFVAGMDCDIPSLQKHGAIHHRLAGNVTQLPFQNESFDMVSANMVVEHLDDPAASLNEIRRVLKPGGVFVFHTPNRHSPAVFLGSLAPDFLKIALARVLEGRAAADVFPTHYRMNSENSIRRFAKCTNFELRDLRFQSTSAGTAVFGWLSAIELLVLRALERQPLRKLRYDLVCVLQKPARAGA